MNDEVLPMPPARSRFGRVMGRLMLALVVLALGAAALAGLAWHEGLFALQPGTAPTVPRSAPNPPLSATSPAAPTAGASQAALDVRVAALEQRLAGIELRASAAEADTAHAEALLAAFAARRAVERGAPLGYLENQLKLRFGDALPNAVATVIAAAHNPVTADKLAAQLGAMAPKLSQPASGWAAVRSGFASLFVIHHADAPPAAPAPRLDHAMLALREGRIGDAITDVRQLPGAAGAQGWIASAQHYQAVEQALDLLETTALLEPRQLRDGAGRLVVEGSVSPPAAPGPAAAPAAPRSSRAPHP